MIPLKDDTPRVSTPYVNCALIVLNTLVFLFELSIGCTAPAVRASVSGWCRCASRSCCSITVMCRGSWCRNWVRALFRPWRRSCLSSHRCFCMQVHLHLIFNMWALWIFGDNVEDRLGHAWYLVFYLICGVAAALFHTLLNASSVVPTVGASGAIAGVMGAYFLLYPRARVLTLVPLFFVFFVWLPAWVVLGYWFVAQFLSGAATSIASHRSNSGGIAFWAHVGGFLAGMLLIKLFPSRARRYHYGW